MAYSFQTYTVGQVLTAASMNQEEVNIRDRVHGEAGVTGTTRAIAPGSHGVYDIGTSTLYYRKGYIQDLPGQAFLNALRFYHDFNIRSSFVRTLTGSGYLSGWPDDGSGVATNIWMMPQSRGVLQLQIGATQGNFARVARAEQWENRAWASLEYVTTLLGFNAWDGTNTQPSFGFGTLSGDARSVNSLACAMWVGVASAAIAPRTIYGGGAIPT